MNSSKIVYELIIILKLGRLLLFSYILEDKKPFIIYGKGLYILDYFWFTGI